MSRNFTKHGTFKATDSDRQIAVGAALVPDAVDRQGDWFRGDTITALADDYMARLPDGEAEQGVMHVKFEDDDITLVENRVLDESETIGDDEFAPGTWILGYKIHDDDLFSLVESKALGGFSIGGTVPEDGESEQPVGDLPDGVSVPDSAGVGADGDGNATAAEITDATVHEVSLVDVPAVPDATVSMMKAAREAAKDGSLTDPDRAEQALRERGHSEDDAALLADYLTKADGLIEKPFAGFDDFDDCVATMQEEQDYDEETAEQVCGRLQEEHKTDTKAASPSGISKAETVGVDVFRIVADDDSDYETDLLGLGVDFPEHDVYVDWHRAAFGDDQLDNPHVSIYGSIDDLRQVTDGTIEPIGTVGSEADGLAAIAGSVVAKADATDPSDTPTNSTDDMTGDDTETTRDASSDTDDADNADEPDDATKWRRFKRWLSGDVSSESDADATEKTDATDTDDGDTTVPEVPGGDVTNALQIAKEGRTLNEPNRRALMAAHDAIETALRSSVEFSGNRFTANPAVDFSLGEYDSGEKAAESADAAGESDTTTKDMSDDDTDTTDDTTEEQRTEKDAPAWANTLIERVEDVEKTVNDLEGDGTGDDVEKSLEDAPEWAQTLSEKVDDLDERVEIVSKTTADTTQAGGAETTDETDGESEAFLKALGS